MPTPSPYVTKAGQPPIEGVQRKPLRVVSDERGWLIGSNAPDVFRLEPHGALPYDWSRKDG